MFSSGWLFSSRLFSDSTRLRTQSSRCRNVLIVLGTLLGFFGILVSGVNGQIDAPSCNASSNYQWSFNSLDQSPCVVASFLGQACDTQYSIPSINTNQHYGGPTTGPQDNPCQCSSVMYILLSACGACQGGSFITWSAYEQNCTRVYVPTFPANIPSDTKVPRWAYQNVTAEDNFNPTEAQAVGDAPESTGTVPPTGTTSVSTPSTTPTVSSQGKKTNAGAIAGGVVGGAIVVLLAVLALLYLRRRRRVRKERGVARAAIDVDDKPRPYPVSTSAVPESNETGTGFHASIPTMSIPSTAMRLYNPSDPSTFPLSTSPSLPHHSPQSSETGVTGYFSSAYHSVGPNRQPGLPEL
ncbi:hypothetical protein J3R30DRAFT_845604 [Lentinula aciculospora]|uniref:Uncharacterized protein n=1 Tax=Lentinula aciculospora TaxID=153920 RepID=A0A9W9APQ6_9AGAR|nr:hypothetical protein J3R30DRAFT_845604 [Lentinula aciculospora]